MDTVTKFVSVICSVYCTVQKKSISTLYSLCPLNNSMQSLCSNFVLQMKSGVHFYPFFSITAVCCCHTGETLPSRQHFPITQQSAVLNKN